MCASFYSSSVEEMQTPVARHDEPSRAEPERQLWMDIVEKFGFQQSLTGPTIQ
jgi:hypothetical protein